MAEENNLETICGPRKWEGEEKEVQATLILDNKNPHDNQAVRVEINGLVVGHLKKEHARQYRKQVKHPQATCRAEIRGGWEKSPTNRGHYGVWLDLPVTEGQASSAPAKQSGSKAPLIIIIVIVLLVMLCGMCSLLGMLSSAFG